MRYFLITYHIPFETRKSQFGTIIITLGNFPPKEYIINQIKEMLNTSLENISITNIFEFKDHKDYNDFKRISCQAN